MPTLEILEEVLIVLEDEFTELEKNTSLYLSPTIMEIPSRRSFEIQVVDGGSIYSDFEGGIQREHFELVIGVFTSILLDSSRQYQKALTHTAKSIHVLKERVKTALEGNFLSELLTRPLRVISETKVREGREHKGLLIKEIRVRGGVNVDR